MAPPAQAESTTPLVLGTVSHQLQFQSSAQPTNIPPVSSTPLGPGQAQSQTSHPMQHSKRPTKIQSAQHLKWNLAWKHKSNPHYSLTPQVKNLYTPRTTSLKLPTNVQFLELPIQHQQQPIQLLQHQCNLFTNHHWSHYSLELITIVLLLILHSHSKVIII